MYMLICTYILGKVTVLLVILIQLLTDFSSDFTYIILIPLVFMVLVAYHSKYTSFEIFIKGIAARLCLDYHYSNVLYFIKLGGRERERERGGE